MIPATGVVEVGWKAAAYLAAAAAVLEHAPAVIVVVRLLALRLPSPLIQQLRASGLGRSVGGRDAHPCGCGDGAVDGAVERKEERLRRERRRAAASAPRG